MWCRIFVTAPQSSSAAQCSYFLLLTFAVTLPLPHRYFFRGQRVAVHEPESLMQMATHAVLSSDGMCLSIHVHNFAYAGWLPECSAGKCYKSNKATAQLTRTHTVTVPAYTTPLTLFRRQYLGKWRQYAFHPFLVNSCSIGVVSFLQEQASKEVITLKT